MTTSTLFQSDHYIELRAFGQLAIPLASAQVAQFAAGFVDTVMMGHLGKGVLAAGALATITFFACIVTASGVMAGVSPLVAEAYGAGDKTRIEQLTQQGLWLALLLTIPLMVGLSHLDVLMGRLGQTETTLELVNAYLDIVVWGLFPALGFAMLRGTMAALSHARAIMVIVIAGTIFNIVANYILGFGKFGFPRLELSGLALGSVLTLWGMFFALSLYLTNHSQLRDYQLFCYRPKLRSFILWELLQLGIPMGIFQGLEIGVYTIVGYLIGLMGIDELAAHQIVFQTANFFFMVPLGMSFAATARVGLKVGQQDHAGIQRAGINSILAGAAWTGIVAIFLLVMSKPIIGLYIDINASDNQAIVTLATTMLHIAAVSHFFNGIQKITYGTLQGLQDTRIPIVFSFVNYWCIALPVGYWLAFNQGLGSTGLWFGLLIAVTVAAIFFVWRFHTLTSKVNPL